jgi:hypothetical protein
MDILRLVSDEGSDSLCGSIPEAVSLKSDDSSTNSELSDGFGAKPLTVSYNSQDRKRVQRNYFQLSDAVLDTFGALQYNCCGFDEDTSTMLDFDVQDRDNCNAFESKHSPDRVSVVVEVSLTIVLTSNGQEEPLKGLLPLFHHRQQQSRTWTTISG